MDSDNPTQPQPTQSIKPIVIGFYGVPGSGKTFFVNSLKHDLGEDQFTFYEGSEAIGAAVPGGLDAFQELEEHEKTHWRQFAIEKIRQECVKSGRVGVVVGHFMFWNEGDETGHTIKTNNYWFDRLGRLWLGWII